MSGTGRSSCTEGTRRILNVIVALVALAVASPLWVIIAVVIKLTSRGPVLFRQLRVGIDRRWTSAGRTPSRRLQDFGGRPFVIYKFRTMVVDAERATGPVWSSRGDSRVTPVGRFLRQCRLDELPQLINVLRGEMNVVGPRPERPVFFAELRAQIPDYQRRQRVRPGITGYAQVTFEADSSLEDVRRKVRYDLEYVERASAWLDLRIMAMTLPVLALRRSLLVPASRRGGPAVTPVPLRGGGGLTPAPDVPPARRALPLVAITNVYDDARR